MTDDTNPDYYKSSSTATGPMEAINVIEAFNLDFCLGNTVKYVLRNGKKDASILELKKARWYLTRRLEQLGDPSGFNAAHDAKDARKDDFQSIAKDIVTDDSPRGALQGLFIQGFKAAYEHLGLRFDP